MRDIKLVKASVSERVRLEEAAVTVRHAELEGLALCAPTGSPEGEWVLHDPVATKWAFQSGAQGLTLARSLVKACAVVGFLSLRRSDRSCGDVWQVTLSAAEHGYGPLMYDTAMSGRRVMPDRVDVSIDAAALWRYYYERRDDVSKEPLGRCPYHADREWLNYSYQLNIPVQTETLCRNHAELCTTLEIPLTTVRTALVNAALVYFDDVMVSAVRVMRDDDAMLAA